MAQKYLTIDDNSEIYDICLSRPDVHNAFNGDFILEITEAFQSVGQDHKAVYLHAEGKNFCAGADINWMKDSANQSQEHNKKEAEELYGMFQTVEACPVPVVTKVHGSVFGGGLGILAASDIAVADRSSLFCFSEVRLGIVPAVISSFVLEKASYRLAAEHMLTGKVFDGHVAQAMGLVNFYGPELEAEKYISDSLNAISDAGATAVRETKALMKKINGSHWRDSREYCTDLIARVRTSEEGQEGLSAFLEKRKASWVKSRES